MKIFAKAAFDRAQIESKMKLGAAGIELHLFSANDSFFDEKWHELAPTEDIHAIHMPFTVDANGRCTDIPIENPTALNILTMVCDRAQYLSSAWGRDIHVIVHLLSPITCLYAVGIYEHLVEQLRHLAGRYSGVTICIENVPEMITEPLSFIRLARDISLPNVGTCIDICHLMMTERASQSVDVIGIDRYSFDDYFTKETQHVHLSRAIWSPAGFGRGSGHGAPFVSASDPILRNTFRKIQTTAPDAMVVIETLESDYVTGNENFTITQTVCKETLTLM